MNSDESFLRLISQLLFFIKSFFFVTALLFGFAVSLFYNGFSSDKREIEQIKPEHTDGVLTSNSDFWMAPDTSEFQKIKNGALIRYGRELIAHTSVYLGPNGKIKKISNGLNCQNCHLNAGTKPFGNNFGEVASKYPVVQPRSGTLVSVEERINGCFERSLNGKRLDESSDEMKAIVAYMKWVGKDIAKGEKRKGFGLKELSFLDRAADHGKGMLVYKKHCASCHGRNGEGQRVESKFEWKYPPLYGNESYNTGAGLYRISKFAAYVKVNMPYGVSYDSPVLTDEESWDVAAFVNTMPHPVKDTSKDWPDISKKPFDHPFGPYADHFSKAQHKYGPFIMMNDLMAVIIKPGQ